MTERQKTKALRKAIEIAEPKPVRCPVCSRRPMVRLGTTLWWVECEDSVHAISIGRARSKNAIRVWNKKFGQ